MCGGGASASTRKVTPRRVCLGFAKWRYPPAYPSRVNHQDAPLYKALNTVLAPGAVVRPWTLDVGYQHMLTTAYEHGDQFLELLIFADWLDLSREPDGQPGKRQPRLIGNRVIEAVFEVERRRGFPQRPSRIGSTHVFRDLESARTFARTFREPLRTQIHECRIVTGERFDADMDWVTRGFDLPAALTPQLDAMRDRAARYWRGELSSPLRFAETLVAGTVEIVRHIETVVG